MLIGFDASLGDAVPIKMRLDQSAAGLAHFPGELVFWPKSYAERTYKLVRWTDMPVGGHFAALEQPKLFVDDVRSFFRKFRG